MKKGNFKISVKTLLIWLVVFITTSCIEELERTSFTYEKLLVVDANISDQVKAHEVRLTYTSPVDGDTDDLLNTVSGAAVWVEDDLGSRIDFLEQSAGAYFSPDNFAGEPGRSYALFITTNEGKQYQSSFEKLVQAPGISEIYNRFAVESTDQKGGATPGVQFFIDVKDANQSTQFYRYEWTDTHQIKVPIIKKYEATAYYVGLAMFYRITPFDEDVQECYREDRFNELILATSANNINGELNEIPVSFSAATDFDVTTMYSIEVTQRAISAQAYSYYRKIKLFNESNGSLFDKQQGIIVGNIISIDSPDEQVLGYFEVAGASSKRIFIAPSELDPEVWEYVVRPCETYSAIEFDGSLTTFYEATDLPEEQRGSVIPIRENYELYDYDQYTGTKFMAHRFCADCRRRGSLGKPNWWQ
ncbi:DUF4249 domain-containing protein [Roseivirga echinicomitans]|uniref:DUF4249 domain-containing protein n=1 Tax=Roseivirga echinicomitans TaxID=296218 RepID=A0A150XDD4_9BACT|nr:DUF4249 domain-containing protein [Roseivirga echinicomitans]KYG76684.1 hypothetical protein AWN68_06565 [Roseivirga echinicomitans]